MRNEGNLFTVRDYDPVRDKMPSPNLFDAEESKRRKESGMKQAAERRKVLLEKVRSVAYGMVLDGMVVTIDDVFERAQKLFGIWPSELGNSAGAVFKSPAFEFVEWRTSTRISNHARPIRAWRLKR